MVNSGAECGVVCGRGQRTLGPPVRTGRYARGAAVAVRVKIQPSGRKIAVGRGGQSH